MAFGRPAPDAEESLSTRVQLTKIRLAKCNSVAEIADILQQVGNEELMRLRVDYNAARPGRSAKELALLHGVRSAISSEVSDRKLNDREENLSPAL